MYENVISRNGKEMSVPDLFDLHERVCKTMKINNNENSRYVFIVIN